MIYGNGSQLTNVPAGGAAGSTTQVQYNDAGSMAGASGLMYEKTTGNVGIGTTAPRSQLVIGAGTINSGTRVAITINNDGYSAPSGPNAISAGDKLVLWNQSSYKAAIGLNDGILMLQSTGNGNGAANIQFLTGNANSPVSAMLIDKDGNVGIGTTAPKSRLQVIGSGTPGSYEIGRAHV